jgi:DNA-binding NarL/FixJ family response regulator
VTETLAPEPSTTDGGGREHDLSVLVADDHPLVLQGLRRALDGSEDVHVVGEANSGGELLRLVERRRPDVVLTDLRMPDVDGVACVERIRACWPEVKVVVLSACESPTDISAALAAGASAYVLKSVKPVDVASVIRQAAQGVVFHAPAVEEPADGGEEELGLTDREREILSGVADGLATKELSRRLWVSDHTIKFHLTNIYRKLGVTNRAGAVRLAYERGLVETD